MAVASLCVPLFLPSILLAQDSSDSGSRLFHHQGMPGLPRGQRHGPGRTVKHPHHQPF